MKPVLLCLHGWGADHRAFDALKKELVGVYVTVISPDLPGFGSEPEPDHQWITRHKLTPTKKNGYSMQKSGISILGHSHGGRIAIKIAKRGNIHIDHLFLCASAGIRHPRHIKRVCGLILAKTGKLFLSIPFLKIFESLGKKFLYKLIRVHDYEKASPIMQKTMINVCKEDLRPLLKSIDVSTDIFWGDADKMTPVSDAYVMKTEIPKSQLHIFHNINHKVHKDKAKDIANIIRKKLL
jgi:pimeloyl-ACP methyl ester carboxylesterase